MYWAVACGLSGIGIYSSYWFLNCGFWLAAAGKLEQILMGCPTQQVFFSCLPLWALMNGVTLWISHFFCDSTIRSLWFQRSLCRYFDLIHTTHSHCHCLASRSAISPNEYPVLFSTGLLVQFRQCGFIFINSSGKRRWWGRWQPTEAFSFSPFFVLGKDGDEDL